MTHGVNLTVDNTARTFAPRGYPARRSAIEHVWGFDLAPVTQNPQQAEFIVGPQGEILWPARYWITAGLGASGTVALQSQAARDATDAAIAADELANTRSQAQGSTSAPGRLSTQVRGVISLSNTRDNYLANRVIELQDLLDQVLAAAIAATNFGDFQARIALATWNGTGAQNPAAAMNTATRTRAAAFQDYRDDIAAGNGDPE